MAVDNRARDVAELQLLSTLVALVEDADVVEPVASAGKDAR